MRNAPSASKAHVLPHSFFIVIRDVKHLVTARDTLKEYGIQFLTADEDELMMYRQRKRGAKYYLYVGTNRQGYLFSAKSVVKHVPKRKLSEVTKWLRSIGMNG